MPPTTCPTMSPAAGLARWLFIAAASAAAACFLTFTPKAQAQEAGPRLVTESPYFFVKGGDPVVDRLPLKSTKVDVRISGVIADVTVTQQYKNEGTRPIEAKYVFPGSTRAAVHGMNVRLADRLITAQIREKQQARIAYDQAKSEGKTAALLEQHLPNVFQMNVANILPGDDVRVELRYTEVLVPSDGNYQFVFPTVVGPRYNSPQSGQAQAKWVAQPVLPAGEKSASAFDIQVALASPIGLKEVRSDTHAVEVTEHGHQRATVSLARTGGMHNNRDFILDYRLAGDKVEAGVLLFRGQGENFFLAMVEPPKHIPATAISPREYIFVVDISGSMHGFPLETAKSLLRELIGNLRPSDSFNVLLFSGSSRFLAPRSVPATRANIEQAIATIERMGGGGSTELIPALRRVYAEPKSPDLSRTVVVVTDGYVTVEREAFELVRKNLSQANVFAFGIGSSVNRHLMEGLARAGMGEPFIITKPTDAPAQAARFRKMIESPVLTSVKARFEGLDVYDVEAVPLPDVLGRRPVWVSGKWRAGDAGAPQGLLVLEGRSAAGAYREMVRAPAPDPQAAPLRQLWAQRRLQQLGDQEALEGGHAQRDEIIALGLKYGVATPYTGFPAEAVPPRGHALPVALSPVPAPAAVPAAPAESGMPEPGTWALLGAASFLTLWVVSRRSMTRSDA